MYYGDRHKDYKHTMKNYKKISFHSKMARYRRQTQRKPNYSNYKRLKKGYRSGGLWGLAKKAASGVVKYYLNPEYKFLDTINTVTPNNLGTIQPLTAIGQGDLLS